MGNFFFREGRWVSPTKASETGFLEKNRCKKKLLKYSPTSLIYLSDWEDSLLCLKMFRETAWNTSLTHRNKYCFSKEVGTYFGQRWPRKIIDKIISEEKICKSVSLTWKMPSFHGDMLGCSQHAGWAVNLHIHATVILAPGIPPPTGKSLRNTFLLRLLPWRRTPEIGHFMSRPILVAEKQLDVPPIPT